MSEYPVVRRRLRLSSVKRYKEGTFVRLYDGNKFILCVVRGCTPLCAGCVLDDSRIDCTLYTSGNALVPAEDVL